jgi:hypothetical protein
MNCGTMISRPFFEYSGLVCIVGLVVNGFACGIDPRFGDRREDDIDRFAFIKLHWNSHLWLQETPRARQGLQWQRNLIESLRIHENCRVCIAVKKLHLLPLQLHVLQAVFRAEAEIFQAASAHITYAGMHVAGHFSLTHMESGFDNLEDVLSNLQYGSGTQLRCDDYRILTGESIS